MKKNIFIILFLIFVISIFSFDSIYNKLFYKPGAYMYYEYNSDAEFSFSLFFINKVPIMETKELLKPVWSQERTLIGGQMKVESDYYTHAISKSRALGILQMKYITADDIYVDNLFDPYDNVKGAVEYNSYLRRIFSTEKKQIAAYHEGPGTIKKYGMTKNGEIYYKKVKSAQASYKNSKVYSPQVFNFQVFYNGTDKIKLDLNYLMAYRKFEIYSGVGTDVNKINGIIKDDTNVSFGALYYPVTDFAYGGNVNFKTSKQNINFNGIIRVGLPWERFVVSIGKENFINYNFQKDMLKFNFFVGKNKLKIDFGMVVYNIEAYIGYEFYNQTFFVDLLLRGA